MPAKQLRYHAEARESLKRGVDALAHAVSVTLGPRSLWVEYEFCTVTGRPATSASCPSSIACAQVYATRKYRPLVMRRLNDTVIP